MSITKTIVSPHYVCRAGLTTFVGELIFFMEVMTAPFTCKKKIPVHKAKKDKPLAIIWQKENQIINYNFSNCKFVLFCQFQNPLSLYLGY